MPVQGYVLIVGDTQFCLSGVERPRLSRLNFAL